MKRLLAYGCSNTNGRWPTWPHILARQFDCELINRGERSACNSFIKKRFDYDVDQGIVRPGDHIMIMWVYFNRRHQVIDHDTFVKKDEATKQLQIQSNLFHTIDIITSVKQKLDSMKINYDFLSWIDVDNPGKNYFTLSKNQSIDHLGIKKSMFELVFENNWLSRKDFAVSYQRIYKDIDKDDRIVSQVPNFIVKNIRRIAKTKGISEIDVIRNRIKKNDNRYEIFNEGHPTILHHLEYLQKIFPKIKWKSSVIDWVNQENAKILGRIW